MIKQPDIHLLKEEYERIPLPEELDTLILDAMKKGRGHCKKTTFLLKPAIAAAVILFFTAGVNISPAFADYLGNIPVVSALVNLLEIDKGLRIAIDNGFIQHVDESVEHQGIRFSIAEVILDRRKMVIGYSLSSPQELRGIRKLKVEGKNGEELNNYMLTEHSGAMEQKDGQTWKGSGIIVVKLMESSSGFPDGMTISCEGFNTYSEGKESVINGSWSIGFDVDKNLIQINPIEFPVNKQIAVNPLEISIDKVIINPTSMGVVMSQHSLTKRIVDFKNLRLQDEHGNVYRPDFTVPTLGDLDNKLILNFESSFFTPFRHLTLKCDGIYYMPLEDVFIKLDLVNNTIIDPQGYSVEWVRQQRNVKNEKGQFDLMVELKVFSVNGNMPRLETTDAFDEKGNYFAAAFSTILNFDSGSQRGLQQLQIYFKDMKNIPDHLLLKVSRDENNLTEPFSIKLK